LSTPLHRVPQIDGRQSRRDGKRFYVPQTRPERTQNGPTPAGGIIRTVPLGIYISVPFCRTKCSYCNFASDVFSRVVFDRYVDRVCTDVADAPEVAKEMGARFEHEVDSIYLGGGTPTVPRPDSCNGSLTRSARSSLCSPMLK